MDGMGMGHTPTVASTAQFVSICVLLTFHLHLISKLQTCPFTWCCPGHAIAVLHLSKLLTKRIWNICWCVPGISVLYVFTNWHPIRDSISLQKIYFVPPLHYELNDPDRLKTFAMQFLCETTLELNCPENSAQDLDFKTIKF